MKTLPLPCNWTPVSNIYERRCARSDSSKARPNNYIPPGSSINEKRLEERCAVQKRRARIPGVGPLRPLLCGSNSDNGTPSRLNVSLTRQKLPSEPITVPRLRRVSLQLSKLPIYRGEALSTCETKLVIAPYIQLKSTYITPWKTGGLGVEWDSLKSAIRVEWKQVCSLCDFLNTRGRKQVVLAAGRLICLREIFDDSPEQQS